MCVFSFKILLLWVAFHISHFSLCLCDISSSVACGCFIFFVRRIIFFFAQFLQIIVKQFTETIIAVVIIIAGEHIEVWSHILLDKLSSDHCWRMCSFIYRDLKQSTTNGVILKTTMFFFFCGLVAPLNWHHESPLSLEQRRSRLIRTAAGLAAACSSTQPGSPLDQSPEQKQTIRMSACCLFDPPDSQREINKKNQSESIRLKTRADICQTFNTDICTTDVQMDSSCSSNPHASNRLHRELLPYRPGDITTTKTRLFVASICWLWIVDGKSNTAGSAAGVLVQLNTGRCFIDSEVTELIRDAR